MSTSQPFRPHPDDALVIDGERYHFTSRPSAAGQPDKHPGDHATVYQVAGGDGLRALKVFGPALRTPRTAAGAQGLRPFATLPGLQVCARTVLTPEGHAELLRQHPDLAYAALMPWVAGETWQSLVASGQPLSADASRALAQSLAHVLATMEQHGLAHGDLSGPNVMVAQGQAALVDVEDLFGPGIARPEQVPGGSPGYAHRTASQAVWGPSADRFAGAVLLAEMLGWCDERVRGLAAGAQFFEPSDVQRDGERYRVLSQSLRQRWGGAVGDAFARAWHSIVLDDCPTFAEWARHIAALPAAQALPASPVPIVPVELGDGRPADVAEAERGREPPLSPIVPARSDAQLPLWRQGERLAALVGVVVIVALLGWILLQSLSARAQTRSTATAQALAMAQSLATVDAQSSAIAGQQVTSVARTATAHAAATQAAAALGVTQTAEAQAALGATSDALVALTSTARVQAAADATAEAAAQLATAAAVPTATLAPTLPTVSAPVTGTLEVAAIPAAQLEQRRAAQGALVAAYRLMRQETFDSAQTKTRWAESRSDPVAARRFGGSYQLTVGPGAALNADLWREKAVGSSYIVELDVSLPTPGTWAGIVFDAAGDRSLERTFAVSDAGAWQMITRRAGQVDVISTTIALQSSAIAGASQINTLRVVRSPSEIQLWANNTPLAAIAVNEAGGRVGVVGMADDRLAAPAIVHVDNFKVWEP